MHRRLILFLFAMFLAYPAWGGEAAKKEAKPEPGNTLRMPFLVAPMSKDGDLFGYAYISSKMICSSISACTAIDIMIPFIQDAFVRDVNDKPIGRANDPKTVDRDLLGARLTAVAKRVVGGDKVKGIVFLEIKFSSLHPSDSTDLVAPPEQAPSQGAAGAPAGGAEKGAEAGKTAASQGATSKPASGPSH